MASGLIHCNRSRISSLACCAEILKLKEDVEIVRKKENLNDDEYKKQDIDHDKEVIGKIKNILNPKLKSIRNKGTVYVPERLNEIMENLTEHIMNNNIEVTEIINIQYGKKMRFKLGLRHAEINLFYGRKGFSTVVSPKTGTNAELNEVMAQMIECFLYESQIN